MSRLCSGLGGGSHAGGGFRRICERGLGRLLDDLGEVQGVLGVLFNESNQALIRAVTLVVDEVTGTGGLELESREASDTERN